MPTKEQLTKRRRSDFYWGFHPGNDHGSNPSSSPEQESSGEIVGSIVYDPEKKDLKVVPQ